METNLCGHRVGSSEVSPRIILNRSPRTYSVDCIILDSPHYFNSHELQIDKYYSTEQLKQLDRMFTHNHELPSLGAGEDDEQ
ncbi:unnamed protein product, partial [Rotaria socialis]